MGTVEDGSGQSSPGGSAIVASRSKTTRPEPAGAVGCHTFRATGITAHLKNGGRLEIAQVDTSVGACA